MLVYNSKADYLKFTQKCSFRFPPSAFQRLQRARRSGTQGEHQGLQRVAHYSSGFEFFHEKREKVTFTGKSWFFGNFAKFQVYVKGEFVGGCDIMVQMHQDGEIRFLFLRKYRIRWFCSAIFSTRKGSRISSAKRRNKFEKIPEENMPYFILVDA